LRSKAKKIFAFLSVSLFQQNRIAHQELKIIRIFGIFPTETEQKSSSNKEILNNLYKRLAQHFLVW